MPAKRDFSYLQTPAVRAKRAKAIRAAVRRRKAATKGGALVTHDAQGPAPVIQYEGLAPKRAYHKRSDDTDRLDVVKGFIATVAMLMGGRPKS